MDDYTRKQLGGGVPFGFTQRFQLRYIATILWAVVVLTVMAIVIALANKFALEGATAECLDG